MSQRGSDSLRQNGSAAYNAFRTKADVRQAVTDMLEPLKRRFTPGCAGLQLGDTAAEYNEAIALMEAFARPLWGLVPHAGGEANQIYGLYT